MGFSEKKSVRRVVGFSFLIFFFFCSSFVPAGSGASEHAKTFGVGDGFQQSFPQLVFAAVLGQQQHVKASVRRW